MMKSVCIFNEEHKLVDIVFEGFTGRERVNDLKEAVDLLRLQNPAVSLKEAVQNGEYNHVPEEEYLRTLYSVKALKQLFHHPNRPESKPALPEINILELLVNALVKVAEQDAELRKLRK